MIVRKALNTEVKAVGKNPDTGMTIFKAVISSDCIDRDKEILIPKGCVADNFLKNPVMADAHNYRNPSVGKVRELGIGERTIEMEFEFAPTDKGKEYEILYSGGYQRSFSVGFAPVGSFKESYIEVREEHIKAGYVEVSLPDGSTYKVDLKRYKDIPRGIWAKWELLEVSPVVVPANPEALLIEGRGFLGVVKGLVEEGGIKNPKVDMMIERMESLLKDLEKEIEMKGVVMSHSTPVDMNLPWDGAKARAALAKWASSDGSGDKDKIDWGKYAKGFAWFDSSKPTNFTSYYLPHHYPINGELVCIWNGLRAAMGALLGARGGVQAIPDSDRKGVYNHLVRHYRDAGKEPPEFREYTEEELKAMFPELYGLEPVKTEEKTEETKETVHQLLQALQDVKESILNELKEILERSEMSNVKLGIVIDYLNDIAAKVTPSGDGQAKEGKEEEPDQGTPISGHEEEVLRSVWEAITGAWKEINSKTTDQN